VAPLRQRLRLLNCSERRVRELRRCLWNYCGLLPIRQRVLDGLPMNTFEKIRNITSEVLSIPENQITADSRFGVDLGADSMGFSELMLSLEGDLEPQIPDQYVQRFASEWAGVTVQEIVNWIDGPTG
jgi:acyl carrier protein